ncbi:hypothetical protein EDD86DRAFT_189307 [Gorgonomyces haynaldii]|nr:hypothetical protein EDD86DRAFT_189307 [Gorgonomyces haynaldii]
MSSAIVYSNATKVKQELEQDTQSLLSGQQSYLYLEPRLRSNLTRLQSLLGDLESIANREVVAQKRQTTLSRLAALRDGYTSLSTIVEKFKQDEQQRMQEEQRKQLLGENSIKNRGNTEKNTILMMDGLLKETDVLNDAESNIERFIQMGRGALDELYEQRSMLKGAQKRLLDAANRLGLSKSVIKFIEQRTVTDRYILYGGIVASIVLMTLFVYYFG